MDFWMAAIEGCGILLAIWLSSWLINEIAMLLFVVLNISNLILHLI